MGAEGQGGSEIRQPLHTKILDRLKSVSFRKSQPTPTSAIDLSQHTSINGEPLRYQRGEANLHFRNQEAVGSSQVYYLGHLITDTLYPEDPHRYGTLTTHDGKPFGNTSSRGGMFLEVFTNREGKQEDDPVFEEIPTGNFSQWESVIMLPPEVTRSFTESGAQQVLERMLWGDYFAYSPGELTHRSITQETDGKWKADIKFNGSGALARNFERNARFRGCSTFTVTRSET